MADPELLALLLGTGTVGQSALEVARALLDRFGGLGGVERAEPGELGAVRGVGRVRAVRIHAALWLGRRALAERFERERVLEAEDAWALLAPRLAGLESEELHGVFLDRRSRVLAIRRITRGNHAFTIVDPRQIFRIALQVGASALILAHNHPADDPTPSPQDLDVTARVARAGQMLGVPLLDHLVVARGGWRSLARLGHVPKARCGDQIWTV